MWVDGQRHTTTAFHWERTTLHSNEITHKFDKLMNKVLQFFWK